MTDDWLAIPPELAVRVQPDAIRGMTEDLFVASGLPEDEAKLAADVLIWADTRGVDTHGVSNMMAVYLAGLKAVDPSLREAAAIDGASETQAFFRVIFPVMRPINIVILVITVIESLRAFDIVFIINKGLNGLELLSTLVTNNIIGETSRVGFGSAIAVVLLVVSVGPIIVYLVRALREDHA